MDGRERIRDAIASADEVLAQPRAQGPSWELPQREPVKAMPGPNLLRLVEEVNSYTSRRLEELAGVIGEECARNESAIRKELRTELANLDDRLRVELKNNMGRSAAELV
jgi:hypothetical protein